MIVNIDKAEILIDRAERQFTRYSAMLGHPVRFRIDLGTLSGQRLGTLLVAELQETHTVRLVSVDSHHDAVTIELPSREGESARHALSNHPWVISYQLQTPAITKSPRAA